MSVKELAKDFYFDNHHLGNFDTITPLYKRYMTSLKELYDGTLREGFYFQEKYPYSLDLRKHAFEYDESFVGILIENDIHELIRKMTGLAVSLSHIQARVCFPYPDGRSSSQEWHRDNYCYDDKYVGSFPPGVKLIFYPEFGDSPEPVLAFVPGSSLSMKYNRNDDFAQITSDSVSSIETSSSQFLLFNTSMIHSTLPVKEKNLRIIYCFNHEHALDANSKKCQERYLRIIDDA